jgi:hypothetical protein
LLRKKKEVVFSIVSLSPCNNNAKNWSYIWFYSVLTHRKHRFLYCCVYSAVA